MTTLTGTMDRPIDRFALRDALVRLREAAVRPDLTLPAWGYRLRGDVLSLGSLAYRDLIDRDTFADCPAGLAAWQERN